MRFRLLILLLFCLPGMLYAGIKPGCGKDKDKDKKEATCKGKSNAASIESFVFVLPSPDKSSICKKKKQFHHTVVNFYKWYLQNENKITSGLSQENKGKDLIPPFNISWQTLHEYFEVIQTKYADWITDIDPDQPGMSGDGAFHTPGKVTGQAGAGAETGGQPAVNFSNLAK